MTDYSLSALESDYDTVLGSLSPQCPALPRPLPDALWGYLELLLSWGATMDLVSQTDPQEIGRAHLTDSLIGATVLSRLAPTTVLDIGSGAGLPGVVLAICLPMVSVTLCEPREKRATFLREVKRKLGLKNVMVVSERLERVESSPVDVIISRAVGSEALFVQRAPTLLSSSGSLVWMVGREWVAPDGVSLVGEFSYSIEGLKPHKVAICRPFP